MKTAIYMRVSKSDSTTDNQLPALRRMAEARGFEVVETIEETMSGAKRRRPGLDRLLQGAHRGEYTVVLTWAIDRLGRTMHGVLDTVLRLERSGVRVISHSEPWLDTGGPVRDLLLAVFGWVAEQERRRTIERTHEGLARARREGRTLGRPRVAVDVDRAQRLRKQGVPLASIAQQLGVGTTTLHRALQRVG